MTPYALASRQVRCPIIQIILHTVSESYRPYLKETYLFDASVFQTNEAESGDSRCPAISHGGLLTYRDTLLCPSALVKQMGPVVCTDT